MRGDTVSASDEITITPPQEVLDTETNFYYKMDDITSSVISDENGDNDGTIVNSATQETFGTTGYALTFDADSLQYVRLGYGKLTTETFENVSVGLWVKTDSQSSQALVSFGETEFYTLGMGLHYTGTPDGGIGLHINTDAGVFYLVAEQNYADNEWHLIIFTYDSGTLKLYIDGFLFATYETGSSYIGSSTADRYGMLGVESDATSAAGTADSYFFTGMITKPFEIYRTLPSEEVAALYQEGEEL